MPKYIYTVQDAQGTVSTGVADASDEDQAVLALQNRGFLILSIQPEQASRKFIGIRKSGTNVSGRELAFFADQVATLITGGVPLVKALSLLGEHTQNKALGNVVLKITKEVGSGGSLHKALEKHPKVFDNIWVSLVQAGEMSGQLPGALKQIAAYAASKETIKSKIITAIAYPAVLMTMSLGVLAYFIVFIVPVFAGIFKDFDLKLPILTQVIVNFSSLIAGYWVLIMVVCVGAFLAAKAYISTPPGRLTWNYIQFGTPVLGDFIKNIIMERLLTTMATLIKSGVSILNALTVLEGSFNNNLIIKGALKKAKADIASGKSVSESFKKTGIFPPLVTEMMWMGEESGKLPDIINTLSRFYQEQIEQFLNRFSSLIDPILVVGIGGIIGVIVMSIFMPIFQLSQIGAK